MLKNRVVVACICCGFKNKGVGIFKFVGLREAKANNGSDNYALQMLGLSAKITRDSGTKSVIT